ncbi:MAG TPA: hypothetical protein VHI52_22535, partial [Verrucomicrobiae bacterium]|nr:hypothetical protein [Verrucomicrobiae bacterium]
MKLNKLLTTTASVLTLAGGAYAANFTSADVGTPTLPGSSTVNGDGTITIKGSGDDIWNATDSFQYYYTSVQGLVWDAVVRVRSLDAPVSEWTKCELMVRQDDGSGKPAGGDPFIGNMTTAAALTGGGSAQNHLGPQIRTARSGSADQIAISPAIPPTYPNTWLKVTRRGSVFSLWYGTDGLDWTLMVPPIDTAVAGQTVGTDNSTTFGTPWNNPILVGIAVTAHDNTALATAVVSDLSIGPGKLPTTLKKAVDNVKDVSAIAGSPTPMVSFTATNDAVGFPTLYQWYKNNQAVTNATSSSYSFLASSGDNGAKVFCQAYLDPLINSNNVPAVYSSTGTVSVVAGIMYTNGLKREVFLGAT